MFLSHYENLPGAVDFTRYWPDCLSLYVVSSIPAWSMTISLISLWVVCISLCQSIKMKPTNMHVTRARTQLKINICSFRRGCQLPSGASAPPLLLCVLVQRCVLCNGMCFTTGSWQCCLSLDIVSSIPTWSTAISCFLCRLYMFPCARESKLNTYLLQGWF